MIVDVSELASIPVAVPDVAEAVLLAPVLLASVVSGLQITSRIGNSFVQLLTRSAVLIEFGLAGEGGGMGSI